MTEIKFSKAIYDLAKIKQATSEFIDLADWRILDGVQNVIVQMTEVKEDYNAVLADEFANYVLALMK